MKIFYITWKITKAITWYIKIDIINICSKSYYDSDLE